MSILHELVLEDAARAGSGRATCRYVHLLDEVMDATSAPAGATWPAWCPPAGMEHVEAIAGNREKMPPKSTYFYPKLLTGLVLNPLS